MNEDDESTQLDGETVLQTQEDELEGNDDAQVDDDSLDEWGNPAGTEYDDEGYPLDEDGNAIGKPAPEVEKETAKSAVPPASIANLAPSLTEEEMAAEAAWAGLSVEQYKGVQALVQREAARMSRASMVSNTYYQREAESNPAFYKAYGGKIQELMAQSGMAPEKMATREAIVGFASAVVYAEAVENNLTVEQALLKIADKIRADKPANKPVPVRREQRVPTPTVSRPAPNSRPMNRKVTNSRTRDVIDDLYDFNPAEKNIVLASDARLTRGSR